MTNLETSRSAGSFRDEKDKLKVIRSFNSSLFKEHENILNNFTTDKEDEFYDVPLKSILEEAKLQRAKEAVTEWGVGRPPSIPFIGWFVEKGRKSKDSKEKGSVATEERLIESEKNTFIGLGRGSTKSKNSDDSYEKGSGNEDEVSPVENSERSKGDENIDTEPISKTLTNANRMLRVSSWGSVFFLITTDILGPTSAPYAVAQVGYVPGALLFFLFGIVAFYTGILLWQMFLKLDSEKYPLRNYGDLVGRISGKTMRYSVDFLQCIQLICNVAVIVLGNGQGLSEIAKERFCFTALVLFWSLAGMILGQIKSFQNFGFLANSAIWMNVFVIIATMACVAHMEPNYSAAAAQGVPYTGPSSPKVIVSGAGSTQFQKQLSAAMNIVYSYGGGLVFVEFMSEMRRPFDFWKGLICAQTFIFCLYLLFGLFVYSQQGQYVINPANQGVSAYGMQTATNIVNLISALIAAGLYGNVAVKVIYQTVLQRFFKAPNLTTRVGRIIWVPLVIVYWAIAYVIASAIPAFSALTTLIGAICVLQFSYTFPPIFKLLLDIQVSALKKDHQANEVEESKKVDIFERAFNWIKKWSSAYADNWIMNTLHIILFLASLATAGLGIYSGAEELVSSYSGHLASPFSCSSNI